MRLAQVYWSVHSTRKQPWPNGPQNPPLLFDVARDHGETAPIDSTSALYKTTLQQLTAARDTHLATVAPVPNQNARGSDPNNAFCGAPNSQEMHPNLPNCTMNPENWAPAAICTSPACVARYDKSGLCKGSSSCKMGLACKTRLTGCPLCAGCAKASRTHVASSSFPPTFPWRNACYAAVPHYCRLCLSSVRRLCIVCTHSCNACLDSVPRPQVPRRPRREPLGLLRRPRQGRRL